MQQMKHRHCSLLLTCILLLMVLTLACELGNGGDGTSTPVPPAARTGNEAINAQRAEGLQPDCSKYAVWEVCP
jgi:hypothetical protein